MGPPSIIIQVIVRIFKGEPEGVFWVDLNCSVSLFRIVFSVLIRVGSVSSRLLYQISKCFKFQKNLHLFGSIGVARRETQGTQLALRIGANGFLILRERNRASHLQRILSF